MTAANYAAALARVLAHEGGYTNHPSDPGGPTNFGITIYGYRKYAKPDATAADVKAMQVEEAKAIYRAKYWDAQRCDELPAGVDYAIFDYGVNSGIGRSGKVLRRLLKLSDETSRITDDVVAAARHADARALAGAICDERVRFLQSLKTWPVFGRGWGRRVAEVRAAALAMTSDAKAVPASVGPVQGKAVVPQSKSQHGAAGAVIVAGGAAAQQAHQSGYSILTVAVIVIAAIAAAGGVYSFIRRSNAARQEKAA